VSAVMPRCSARPAFEQPERGWNCSATTMHSAGARLVEYAAVGA